MALSTPTKISSQPQPTLKPQSKNEQIQQEQEEWLKKKPRFLTCKEAMDRIQWDPELTDAYQHLSFIYKDRFEGDTFISYEEFLNSDLAEELPQHRIQQLIYREEIIFWDKRNRIDMLSTGELAGIIQNIKRKEQEAQDALNNALNNYSTVLTPAPKETSKSKKQQKKNKKIMKEFTRQQTSDKVHTTSSSDEDDSDFDRYMDEYDEQFGSLSAYNM